MLDGMVNVSKVPLSKRKLAELFAQLNGAIGRLDSRKSELFLASFLGPEEKIMLAKRLAAIIMLHHGQSLYRVADALKVSPTTAKNYKRALQQGTYDELFRALQKRKASYVELIETIDSILHLGGALPHYGESYRSEAYKRSRQPRKN